MNRLSTELYEQTTPVYTNIRKLSLTMKIKTISSVPVGAVAAMTVTIAMVAVLAR